MALTPNYSTQENRDYWRFVYKTVLDTAKWPAWKRNGHDIDTRHAEAELKKLDEMERGCIWL